MVTAILPSVTKSANQIAFPAPQARGNGRLASGSAESDQTVTPSRWAEQHSSLDSRHGLPWYSMSGTRLAGFVGTFAGFGALLALGCFLPLPSLFETSRYSPEDALKVTYYLVGSISLIIAIVSYFGLRGLRGEEGKGLYTIYACDASHDVASATSRESRLPYWRLFYYSIHACRQPYIGLGYVGGFVARASSVGISLFLPLLVNHYYISSGLCKVDDTTAIKTQCREAYILAAKLTGVSQLMALVLAPAYGFFSDKHGHFHIPLLVASACGILGHGAFSFLVQSPDPSQEHGSNLIYIWVSLLGASQIGAIVCSLGLISRGVAAQDNTPCILEPSRSSSFEEETHPSHAQNPDQDPLFDNETDRLLQNPLKDEAMLQHFQGSIAGTYSLAGGVGILFLTKVGGSLFDDFVASPFIILFISYIMLFVATVLDGLLRSRASREVVK